MFAELSRGLRNVAHSSKGCVNAWPSDAMSATHYLFWKILQMRRIALRNLFHGPMRISSAIMN